VFLSADPQDEQWTRTTRDSEGWVLERDITTIDLKAISRWSEPLYLVLLIEPEKRPLTNEDIRRFLVTFL
jgi:hypothetical protein